jgi:predicted nucleic acid-binding protein
MGLTVLDAGVVIAVLDGSDAHHAPAVHAVTSTATRGDHLVVPASAYAEILVGPFKAGEQAVATVDAFLGRLGVEIAHADAEVARRAAHLRARHRSLRLPDALVIATADRHRADLLMTTDEGWPAARSLGVSCRIERIGRQD